jgi:hypothetical protein
MMADKPLDTLRLLPDMDGAARFSAISLGADRINDIRSEFTLVRNLAAAYCGVAPERLTKAEAEAALRLLHTTTCNAAGIAMHLSAFLERLDVGAASRDDVTGIVLLLLAFRRDTTAPEVWG